ncbi:MAG: hypothetical protein WC951_04460 [Bacteroidales bacterium]
MDKLKTFINANRDHFNTNDLPKQHFERFEEKWALRYSPKSFNKWLVASAAAIAGLIITAGLSLLLSSVEMPFSGDKTIVMSELPPEIFKIDEYYQGQVSEKQMQINRILTNTNSLDIDVTQVLVDMNEGHAVVLKDIANSPRTERATFVLIRYYQTQLDVLNNIIERMSAVSLLNNL